MTRRHLSALVLVVAFGLAGDLVDRVSAQSGGGEHWVTTWATALVPRASQPSSASPTGQAAQPPPRFNNQTLRQIVRVSLGGEQVRVVLSNTFGTASLPVGAARVALRQGDAAIVPGSSRLLTFGGCPAAAIPAGAVAVSDPVSLSLPAFADLVIDVHLTGDSAATSSPLTSHANALQTNYLSGPGDHAGASDLPGASPLTAWFFLARVEVMAPARVGAVALLGDSITDGSRSTPDTNNRWPDHLARALAAAGTPMGVVNLGIGGNRLLADGNSPSALARFDRDVLVPPGVTHLVVMEGINDLGRGTTADDVIAAHKQILERARARGLTVIGATITPVEDTTFEGYFTPAHEAARQAVNSWIRTSGAYDAVIDFDAVVRDQARPARLRQDYASSDFIHPNDAGYRAMGNAVNPAYFRPRQTVGSR
ncbi:MAG: SGNH/GDSL hydrolase family protein [Acidobacteria bacterium]|nr:SGNH/GDSL hydrolase family protein [Acidobacteriota bacterium]